MDCDPHRDGQRFVVRAHEILNRIFGAGVRRSANLKASLIVRLRYFKARLRERRPESRAVLEFEYYKTKFTSCAPSAKGVSSACCRAVCSVIHFNLNNFILAPVPTTIHAPGAALAFFQAIGRGR